MTTATCEITTANASKYLQQLCKHFSHKIAATWTESTGRIAFPALGTVDLTATDERLVLTVDPETDDQLAPLQDVVIRHLERFAFRETLAVDWRRGAARSSGGPDVA